MSDDAEYTLPDWADQYSSALDERMGFEMLHLSADRAVGRVPVAGNTQPFGLWHGGASCVLAETLGSMASYAHALGLGKQVAMGVDINATHHKPVRAGYVTGTATAVHLGKSTTCYEVVLTDEAGDRVCTARITCAIR